MVFRIKSRNERYNAAIVKYYAKRFIYLARLGSTETLLNNYLIKTYKVPLLTACILVINKARYSFNDNEEMIITFPEKNIDNLASIITFGTGGKIQGSNILKLAFGQN